uniref:Uncharacterized protein n=1 Tax=Parascaris equorum TaxID=6256 RepID=A0A914RYH3_PAREQ
LFVCVCVFSGTHLASSKKKDKLHAEPPSLRPPKTNITVSGSKKKILSSLCSSHKKALCVTVPGSEPKSLPAPLPLAQVPYFPSENTPESSQYIPAPPPVVAGYESTSTPSSVVEPAPFLLPKPEAAITPASQAPIPLNANVHLPVSPIPQAPLPALPQAGPSSVSTSYQPWELTQTFGILPPRKSNNEKNTTLLMSFSGPSFPSNASAGSGVSKFEFHENHELSRGEGPQPFEPSSNAKGSQAEEEYYDNEREAPPGKIIRSRANAGSSYKGIFDNGPRNGGFVSNLGTAQGGQQFTAVNNNFANGGNVGIPSGVAGKTIGMFANGGEAFQGQASRGQPLGAQQHLQQLMPSGAEGDGCCGGNWFSRSGGLCSPINFNPCLPTQCSSIMCDKFILLEVEAISECFQDVAVVAVLEQTVQQRNRYVNHHVSHHVVSLQTHVPKDERGQPH